MAHVVNSTDEIILYAFCDMNFNHTHAFRLIESLVRSMQLDNRKYCLEEDYQYIAASFISAHYDPFLPQDLSEEYQLFHDILYFLSSVCDNIINPISINADVNGLYTEIYQGGHQMMIASF